MRPSRLGPPLPTPAVAAVRRRAGSVSLLLEKRMFLNAEQKEIVMPGPEDQDPRFQEDPELLREPAATTVPTFCGYTVDTLQDLERERDLERAKRIAAETEAEHRRVELASIHPALREAAELAFRKSQDYGDPDWSRRSYFPFGHESYLQMIHTKTERLKNVAAKGSTNFESARDSALDLINYASFYVAWMDEERQTDFLEKADEDYQERKRALDAEVHAAVHTGPVDLGPIKVERDAEGQVLALSSPRGLRVPCTDELLAEDGMLAPKADPNLKPLETPDHLVKLDTQPAKLKLPPRIQAQVGEALAAGYLADPAAFAAKDPGLAAFADAIKDDAFDDAAELRTEANALRARLRDREEDDAPSTSVPRGNTLPR